MPVVFLYCSTIRVYTIPAPVVWAFRERARVKPKEMIDDDALYLTLPYAIRRTVLVATITDRLTAVMFANNCSVSFLSMFDFVRPGAMISADNICDYCYDKYYYYYYVWCPNFQEHQYQKSCEKVSIFVYIKEDWPRTADLPLMVRTFQMIIVIIKKKNDEDSLKV